MGLFDRFKKQSGTGGGAGATQTREQNRLLEERRMAFFKCFGPVSEQVVSRLAIPIGGSPWPASPLGRMRIIHRELTRILVTDGLSSLYDPEVHPKPPRFPLDFELAIEVWNEDPATRSDRALAESWFPPLLYGLADWMVRDNFDLRGILSKFRAVTVGVRPTTPEAATLADPSGWVRLLIGMPLVGKDLNKHPYSHDYYLPFAKAALGLFPVKPLTPDEYRWAESRGNEGGVLLAEKFLARGDWRFAWTGRPSVLEVPNLDDAQPAAPSGPLGSPAVSTERSSGQAKQPDDSASATSFAVGDKVVLLPVGVMTITAIGTRESLTPAGTENVHLDVGGALFQGRSVLATVPADDQFAFELRFISDPQSSTLLLVTAAEEEGLRHVSTPSEIDAFLRTIHETLAASRQGAKKPDDLTRAILRARNDLKRLATLYPFLAADPHDQWYPIESDLRRRLRDFFIDEIAVAKAIGQEHAQTMFDDAMR